MTETQTEVEVGRDVEVRELSRSLDDLGRRSEVLIRPGTEQVPEQPVETGGYFRNALRSKVVQYGAAAILSFGTGVYFKDNFMKGSSAAADSAKRGIGYVAGALFSALPKEQRYEIMRDNAKSMTPKELTDQIRKLEK